MSTVELRDEHWSRILEFLRSCPDLYVGQESESRRFIEGILWMARSGAAILTDTEFRLLHLLIKNKYTALSQDFIQSALWSDDTVQKHSIKKYVQRLRQKLGDDAKNPTWIQTVRGVGYRFNITSPAIQESISAP